MGNDKTARQIIIVSLPEFLQSSRFRERSLPLGLPQISVLPFCTLSPLPHPTARPVKHGSEILDCE